MNDNASNGCLSVGMPVQKDGGMDPKEVNLAGQWLSLGKISEPDKIRE
jgi:hypothetical protein